MNVFMSLWTKPSNNINSSFIDMWKLSLSLAKKNYESVDLITDKKGYEILKKLPFNNFYVVLDDIPDYPTVWSLGKVYAYDYICELSKHFLHLDSDVFLWEKLPPKLTESDIFCQSYDLLIGGYYYNLSEVSKALNKSLPKQWIDYDRLLTYNMGIVGGKRIDIFKTYCSMVKDMITNPEFCWLWDLKDFDFVDNKQFVLNNRKSIFIEQANFAICCKACGIKPEILFQNYNDPKLKEITYKKYSHLMFMKKNKSILHRISKRVQKEPYDLEPNESQE